MKAVCVAICSTVFASSAVLAQEEQGWMDELLTKLGSSETVDESKLIDWGVLPGPFVNPEQGFGIGVAAVGLYTLMIGTKAPLFDVNRHILCIHFRLIWAWSE
ncbi:outer membrane protein [Vibrio ponticus]|nr:outer membrane protein [Vibrio ponticus]